MTVARYSLLGIISAALLLTAPAAAQNLPRLELLPESRVWVEGTSSREDWTVETTAVDGFVVLQAPARGELSFQRAQFSVSSETLEGGRGVIMDRLMHDALKSSEHPDIVYQLASAESTPAGAGKFTLATRGRVTLAGVTQDIEAVATAQRGADGNLRFTGSYPLRMSDYGITAPTAMFGALRTGDRVVIHFDLLVRP